MNIIEINDFSLPGTEVYANLSEPQLLHYFEPKGGLFLAESPMIIERALRAGYRPLSLLLEKRSLDKMTGLLALCGDVPVYIGDFESLSRQTGFRFSLTRGALCAMHRGALPSIEAVCRDARRIAILENVVNPTNVGAIFRSAAALNIDGILLTPASSDPLYRRSIRVSMATVFQIPWTYMEEDTCAWPGPALAQLRGMGFETAAMALSEDSVFIDDSSLEGIDRLAIILGTEGDGLAPTTIAACDHTVKIPMAHGVDSLNVAAASAVAFWALRAK